MLAAGSGPWLQRVLVEPMLAGGVEVHIGNAPVRTMPNLSGLSPERPAPGVL